MITIGKENWNCDGYSLNPDMRHEILAALAQQYDEWTEAGESWAWAYYEDAPWYGRMVRGPQNTVNTVTDFLGENSGETHWVNRGWPLSYGDWLAEWLKESLFEAWGPEVYDVLDDDRDPLVRAENKVFEWVESLQLADIMAWYKVQAAKEEESAAVPL